MIGVSGQAGEPLGTCTLVASDDAGRSQPWRWTVQGMGCGTLALHPDGPGVVYRAPQTAAFRTFQVIATNLVTGVSQRFAVKVRPACAPEHEFIFKTLLPATCLVGVSFADGRDRYNSLAGGLGLVQLELSPDSFTGGALSVDEGIRELPSAPGQAPREAAPTRKRQLADNLLLGAAAPARLDAEALMELLRQ